METDGEAFGRTMILRTEGGGVRTQNRHTLCLEAVSLMTLKRSEKKDKYLRMEAVALSCQGVQCVFQQLQIKYPVYKNVTEFLKGFFTGRVLGDCFLHCLAAFVCWCESLNPGERSYTCSISSSLAFTSPFFLFWSVFLEEQSSKKGRHLPGAIVRPAQV